jgi:hypothetical protein
VSRDPLSKEEFLKKLSSSVEFNIYVWPDIPEMYPGFILKLPEGIAATQVMWF